VAEPKLVEPSQEAPARRPATQEPAEARERGPELSLEPPLSAPAGRENVEAATRPRRPASPAAGRVPAARAMTGFQAGVGNLRAAPLIAESAAPAAEERVSRAEEPVSRAAEPVSRAEGLVSRAEEPVSRAGAPVVQSEEPVSRAEEPVPEAVAELQATLQTVAEPAAEPPPTAVAPLAPTTPAAPAAPPPPAAPPGGALPEAGALASAPATAGQAALPGQAAGAAPPGVPPPAAPVSTPGEGGVLPEGTEEAFAEDTAGLQATLASTPVVAGGVSLLGAPPALIDFARSPIDPGQDNVAVLRQHLADASAAAMTTVATNADDAVLSARGSAELVKGRIDEAVAMEIAAVQAGTQRTVVLSDEEYALAAEALKNAKQNAIDSINGTTDAAIAAIGEERLKRRQEVESAIAARATQIVGHGVTQGNAVRNEGDKRARRAVELANETYVRYQSHDKASDVRESVDEIAEEAAGRFRGESVQLSNDLMAGAGSIAGIWNEEVPTALAAIDTGHADSVGELGRAREWALGEIERRSGELAAELEGTRVTVGQGVATERATIEDQLAASRNLAFARIDAALLQFEALVAERSALAMEELLTVQAQQETAIAELFDEVGNLFNADDMREPLHAAFAAGMAPWLQALSQARADFDSQLTSAEATFVAEAADYHREALGAIGTELERGQTGLAAVVGGFEKALMETSSGCVLAIVGVQDSATVAMGAIAQNIVTTLDQGYAAAQAALDQGVSKLRTSHSGALYDLPKLYDDAAKEAIKPWWRKLLEWVWGALKGLFWAYVDLWVWQVQTMANIVWGFIWGEAVFPDAWGAGVVVFVADLAAGVLVIGDIRDVLKWGLINPFIRGQGWSWLNTLMLGASLFGIIPLIGDVTKAGAKAGIKALVKTLGKELTERLLREIGEEALERLLKEVGEETLEKLARELGEEGFARLVKELGEETFKELAQKLGPDLLAKLAKGLPPEMLKEAAQKLGAEVLKETAERLGAAALKDVITHIGTDALKELLERVGAAGVKDLLDNIGAAAVKELKERLGTQVLGELTMALRGPGMKAVFDHLGSDALARLVKEIGTDAVKPLVDTFGAEALGKVVKDLTPELAGQLAKELGPTVLKDLSDRVGTPLLRQLTDEVGAAGVKGLVDQLGPEAVESFVKEMGGQAFGQFAKELTAAEIKLIVDAIAAASGTTASVAARTIAATVQDVGLGVYAQFFRQGGPALVQRLVRQGAISDVWLKGAKGADPAVTKLANRALRLTQEATNEIRRLHHLATTQGLQAVPLGHIPQEARRQVEKFLETTKPGLVQTNFGTAVQFLAESGVRKEFSGLLYRLRHRAGREGFPDIQKEIAPGRWAILDWTTAAKQGKASDLYDAKVVDYVIEIIQPGL
jgi:hypothetical protein